jgi:cardiolipin synthase
MASRSLGLVVLLVVLAGCQAPPAHLACFDPESGGPSRKGLMLRQMLKDKAVWTAEHPFLEAVNIASLPVDYARAIALLARRKIVLLSTLHEPPPIPCDRPTLDPDELEAALQHRLKDELQPGWVNVYPTGESAEEALHNVIDLAGCRIDVMMYLWDNDPLGWRVAKHLAAVASEHRPVRILVDGAANLSQGLPKEATTAEVNEVVCWLSHQPHIELIRTRDPCLHLDHRKLVVVDSKIAWSGGRNFTFPAFYKDRDVSYTVLGPLACQMQDIFDKFWMEQGGQPVEPLPPPPPLPAQNVMARLVETTATNYSLSQAIYLALDRAKHHIYMENPYLSDNKVLLKLVNARKRGVDVRVVMTTDDDSETINSANKVTMNLLFNNGVRVYHYPSFTHAKCTAIDGMWAYVGTGNFDRTSLRRNHELSLAISAGPVIAEIEDVIFHEDFKPEWELTAPLHITIGDLLKSRLASLFL